MAINETRDFDAFVRPRRIQPGCMHQLGCKCDPPYWLREPSEAELKRWWRRPEPEPRELLDSRAPRLERSAPDGPTGTGEISP